MTEQEFKFRTRKFALDVIHFIDELPRDRVTDHLARQLLRSGTSVGTNYRAACRGRSDAEMAAKLGIFEEEADECIYWLDLLVDADRANPERVAALSQEAHELISIVVTSIKTLRTRMGRSLQVRELASSYRIAEWDDAVLSPDIQSTIHNQK